MGFFPRVVNEHCSKPRAFPGLVGVRFGAAALSIAAILAFNGRGATLVPGAGAVIAAIAIGLTFGALANGSLFLAIGMAPNPGLPPVVYASSSVIVFALSALLAGAFPSLFAPVSTDLGRLAGVILVLCGLYLLAGGRLP